jgi:methylglyoxal synthase
MRSIRAWCAALLAAAAITVVASMLTTSHATATTRQAHAHNSTFMTGDQQLQMHCSTAALQTLILFYKPQQTA